MNEDQRGREGRLLPGPGRDSDEPRLGEVCKKKLQIPQVKDIFNFLWGSWLRPRDMTRTFRRKSRGGRTGVQPWRRPGPSMPTGGPTVNQVSPLLWGMASSVPRVSRDAEVRVWGPQFSPQFSQSTSALVCLIY